MTNGNMKTQRKSQFSYKSNTEMLLLLLH